jgi:hypothetical protein
MNELFYFAGLYRIFHPCLFSADFTTHKVGPTTDRMWVHNASQYPDDTVRQLVRFASLVSDVRDVQVDVKDCNRAYRGRAYRSIPAIARAHARARYLVVIRIGAPSLFPCTNEVTSIRWTTVEGDDVSPAMRVRATRKGLQFERPVALRHPYGGTSAPVITYRDWREALVGVAAHEFHHVDQYRFGRRVSEVACERRALLVLVRWRDDAAISSREIE